MIPVCHGSDGVGGGSDDLVRKHVAKRHVLVLVELPAALAPGARARSGDRASFYPPNKFEQLAVFQAGPDASQLYVLVNDLAYPTKPHKILVCMCRVVPGEESTLQVVRVAAEGETVITLHVSNTPGNAGYRLMDDVVNCLEPGSVMHLHVSTQGQHTSVHLRVIRWDGGGDFQETPAVFPAGLPPGWSELPGSRAALRAPDNSGKVAKLQTLHKQLEKFILVVAKLL